MVVLGARREITLLSVGVAFGLGAVGVGLSVYLDGTNGAWERVASYFPPGPWRLAAGALSVIALTAVVLTGLEMVTFGWGSKTFAKLPEGTPQSVERTLQEVRTEVQKCLANRSPDVPLGMDILLRGAIVIHASDIHFNPSSEGLHVTYRVDGVLREVLTMPPEHATRLTSRVKVMSRLETYSREPQDGVLRRRVGNIDVEARVSVLPANYGERVVLRLVRGGESVRPLADIGFSDDVEQRLKAVLARPQGIVFVSGPVGSGKTTSLYSALHHLHETRGNTTSLISLEDPIELQLPFVTQTQMNRKVGMTFAQTLRSVLRQDPGALMVGEIRDRETAEIATQAGLTGHLILTTLHVESAAGTFTRLREMGIESYILATSCSAALAQRLVRTLCPSCRRLAAPSPAELSRLRELDAFAPEGTYFEAVGCAVCEGQGYLGRAPIAELLIVSEEIQTAVRSGAGTEEVARIARSQGMETLVEAGARLAANGQTTLAEVLRVAG